MIAACVTQGTGWKRIQAETSWTAETAPVDFSIPEVCITTLACRKLGMPRTDETRPQVKKFQVVASEHTPVHLTLARVVTPGSELPEDGFMGLGVVPEGQFDSSEVARSPYVVGHQVQAVVMLEKGTYELQVIVERRHDRQRVDHGFTLSIEYDGALEENPLICPTHRDLCAGIGVLCHRRGEEA